MNEPRWLSAQFPYPPRVDSVPGGTMAWVESGRGRDVVCVHGNPTWSFLWRKVMAALEGQRLHLLAPDLLGCGRSSKPRSVAWHTLDRHAAALGAWMEARRLVDPILVVQDWGGPIGLLAAARSPAVRVSAVCLLNTGVVLPGRFRGTPFHRLARVPVVAPLLFRGLGFPLQLLARVQGDRRSISGDVARAYRWPFRTLADRAAPLGLARMVPDSAAHPSVPGLRVADAWIRQFPGPVELVWGREDPLLGRALRRHAEQLPRARVTETDAGHFLQEEVPDIIARSIRRLAGMLEAP
ncbi:MAG TPA: alpha/beta fold hydrolase [Myxococcaceae bacterium]|nr:alpha/beta fold hydrolase [Myxococcaceae bacterium]